MNHLYAFCQLAGDTALWLVWGSLVLSLFAVVSDLLPLVPAFGLLAMLADCVPPKRKALRYLVLIPGLALLYRYPANADRLMIAPMLAYLAICITQGTLQPNPTEVYYRFRLRMGLGILGGVFCMTAGRVWAFDCAVFSLVIGVFLMRMLRHSDADHRNKRLFALEAGLMTAVCLLCYLLSREPVLQAGLTVLKYGYRLIALPVLTLLLFLFYLLLLCMSALLGGLFTGEIRFPGQDLGGAFEDVQQFMPMEQQGPNPLAQLLAQAAGILLFCTAVYFVLRWLRSGAGIPLPETAEEDPAAQIEDVDRVYTPGILDRTPEGRIRRTYAAYLRLISQKGNRIHPIDTSRSVNRLANAETLPEAVELRQLYLRARYTRRAGLTAADAKKAAALLRQLRTKLD